MLKILLEKGYVERTLHSPTISGVTIYICYLSLSLDDAMCNH